MKFAILTILAVTAPAFQDGGKPASKPSNEELAFEWNQKGIAYKKENKTKEAIDAFEMALKFAPKDAVITKNLGGAWNDEGVRRLDKENNAAGAIAAFETAIRLNGPEPAIQVNMAVAHERRGTEYLQKKSWDLALADYEAAKALDPASGRYPTSIAFVAFQREDYDSAERQLESCLKIFEKEVDAWILLGETCYKKGDLKRAVECYEKALQLDPKRAGLGEKLEKVKNETKVEGDFIPQNSSHFQFRFPRDQKHLQAAADSIAGVLEEAWFAVGRNYDFYPDGRTQVIFYEVKDFSAVTRSDEWVGAIYDGKIRVPIRDFEKNRDSLRKTLFHEYTHRVIHALAAGKCPTWLNEGLAQTSEESSRADAERRLREAPELLLDAATLRGSFVGKLSTQRARVAYDQSLSLTQFLLEQRGMSSLLRYFKWMAGDATNPPLAEAKAFEQEFRFTLDEFITRWRLSMNFPEEEKRDR